VASTIRIVSANLCNGSADAAAFAEVLRVHAVDVAALQELSPEQAEAVGAILPFGRLAPARDHTGMGIALSRPARERTLKLPVRDARIAELDPAVWPGLAAPLELLNVHILGPHVAPLWRSFARRRKQLRCLLAYLDATHGRRQLLVGDFNATSLSPAYRRIAARRFDAARLAAPPRRPWAAPTWGPWCWAPRVLRIDHAFLQNLTVENVRVVRVAGSDHSALIVDVVAD
jgi:endonuclease/exonuclease/phosphatase family metal-dependent hydrolase